MNWIIEKGFHKHHINRIKKATGAKYVSHIKNCHREGRKVNVLNIKKKWMDFKFPIDKDFKNWTSNDYERALLSFKDVENKYKDIK